MMSRASGTESSVAVITSSCPGASPSPARTATSARWSRFFSNSGVLAKGPLADTVVEVMASIIARGPRIDNARKLAGALRFLARSCTLSGGIRGYNQNPGPYVYLDEGRRRLVFVLHLGSAFGKGGMES